MKQHIQRTFRSVHTWTGLIAGLALFIAFYTGAFTVFTHELHEWDAYPAWDVREEPLADAQPLIDGVLAQHPEAGTRFNLSLPGEHGPRHVVYWYQQHEDGTYQGHEFRLGDGGVESSKDPAHLAGLLYRLHYTAGLPETWGLYLLGIVCVVYGVALVSGVVIFAPGFFKDLFALRPGANLKRFWQDAHNVVGMLSLPFHVLFAWSSAVLAIGTLLLAPFQFLVFEGDLLEVIEADLEVLGPAQPAGTPAPMLGPEELVTRALAALPTLKVELLSYTHAGDANAQVTAYGPVDSEALLPMGGVAMSAVDGSVLKVAHPQHLTPGATFLRGLTTLHFADFGDLGVKWVYFLLSLAGAFLFYTGNLLWVETRRARRTERQPTSVRVMAQLTVGVCVGCMAGVSAAFVASRLLADFPFRPEGVEWAYYGVFLGSVVWALLRPPYAAAWELLTGCAVLTLAIPIVGAWMIDLAPWQALMAGEWLLLAVDLLCLTFAWGFWRMAGAVGARSRTGDPNSVWAAPAPSGGAEEPTVRFT